MLKTGRILFFLAVLIFSSQMSAYAVRADFQYWKIESISWKIADDWKLSLAEEVYFRDDASDYYHEHTELGLAYSGIAKWLEVGLNFRHALDESTKSIWKKEEQPGFHATIKHTIKGFIVSDRNRFEYKIREDATDLWNYRNLLTIRAPWKFTFLEIQPYIAHETFANETLSEIRSFAGFGFKITKNSGAEIFYMQKRNRGGGGHWTGVNAVGTRLKLDF
jgi:hypothetical protein